MTKGLIRSRARAAPQRSPVQTLRIPVTNLSVSMTDVAAAAGWGTAVMRGFPEGNILFLGAVCNLQASSASGTITTTFAATMALGSAATADNTLSGAEVDLIPATAMGAATAKVSPLARGASSANGVIFDNTVGSTNINLNVTIADAGISGAATVTFNGAVFMTFVVLGDD